MFPSLEKGKNKELISKRALIHIWSKLSYQQNTMKCPKIHIWTHISSFQHVQFQSYAHQQFPENFGFLNNFDSIQVLKMEI